MHTTLSISSRGQLMSLDSPKIMGIINATPDSFYTKDLPNTWNDIQKRIALMINEGVDIIDIGGMSTRPASLPISTQEEIDRVAPVAEWTRKEFPDIFISIDTYRASVVAACIPFQIDIVNDISGASMEPDILDICAAHQLTYVASHIQGTPTDMQQNPHYEDILLEVTDYFIHLIKKLHDKGVYKIILDPGFGFGKTVEHNYQLLDIYHHLQYLNIPMMAGISRKSMIWKTLDSTPQDSLYGSLAAQIIAMQKGAHIIRTHDIQATKDTITILEKYKHYH